MDAIKEGMLASAKAAEAAARLGERLFCQNTQSVMNFKSQICTTREQSERLLSLGLKKETADMCWQALDGEPITYPYVWMNGSIITNNHFPAWSLHRLIEMMPNVIGTQGWLSIGHQGLHYSRGYGVADDGLYESIVRMYEWLIKEGYFNKEYLENEMEEKA